MRAKLERRFPISFMTVCLFEPCFTLFLSFGVSAQLKSPPIIKLLSENPRRVWFKFDKTLFVVECHLERIHW